jgi:hypothetical protein
LSFANKIIIIYFQISYSVIFTNEDHKRAVIEGIWTIGYVNAPFVVDEQPFVLDGDPKSLDLKSFWYKVKCTFCNDFFSTMRSKQEFGGKFEESHRRDQTCKSNWRCFE